MRVDCTMMTPIDSFATMHVNIEEETSSVSASAKQKERDTLAVVFFMCAEKVETAKRKG